jgi:hypothetical protein
MERNLKTPVKVARLDPTPQRLRTPYWYPYQQGNVLALNQRHLFVFMYLFQSVWGPGYGLGNWGSIPGGGFFNQPLRLAGSGARPAPAPWVPGAPVPRVTCGRDVMLTPHGLLVPRLRERGGLYLLCSPNSFWCIAGLRCDLFIYLSVCGILYYAVSSADYTASTDMIINE